MGIESELDALSDVTDNESDNELDIPDSSGGGTHMSHHNLVNFSSKHYNQEKNRHCFIYGSDVDAEIIETSRESYHLGDKYRYTIQVSHNEMKWLIYRHHSDFRSLHKSLMMYKSKHVLHVTALGRRPRTKSFLEEQNKIKLKLPKKPDIMLRDQSDVDKRQMKLNRYLKCLLHSNFYRKAPHTLKFFEVSYLSFAPDYGTKLKEGELSKRGGGYTRVALCCTVPRTSWQKRWVVLKDSVLTYMDSHNGQTREAMLIDYDTSVNMTRASRSKFLLHVQNNYRELVLKADNELEAKAWFSSINSAIATQQQKAFQHKNYRHGAFSPSTEGYANWFVDGDQYFATVADLLDKAKEEIYITDWWLTPELYMKRPMVEGDYWRLDRILLRRAEQNVKIFILIYKDFSMAMALDTYVTKKFLSTLHPNIKVMRHPARALNGIFLWSHHEKIVVIDQVIAFVGGLDLCYGRWDDQQHRLTDLGYLSQEDDMTTPSGVDRTFVKKLLQNYDKITTRGGGGGGSRSQTPDEEEGETSPPLIQVEDDVEERRVENLYDDEQLYAEIQASQYHQQQQHESDTEGLSAAAAFRKRSIRYWSNAVEKLKKRSSGMDISDRADFSHLQAFSEDDERTRFIDGRRQDMRDQGELDDKPSVGDRTPQLRRISTWQRLQRAFSRSDSRGFESVPTHVADQPDKDIEATASLLVPSLDKAVDESDFQSLEYADIPDNTPTIDFPDRKTSDEIGSYSGESSLNNNSQNVPEVEVPKVDQPTHFSDVVIALVQSGSTFKPNSSSVVDNNSNVSNHSSLTSAQTSAGIGRRRKFGVVQRPFLIPPDIDEDIEEQEEPKVNSEEEVFGNVKSADQKTSVKKDMTVKKRSKTTSGITEADFSFLSPPADYDTADQKQRHFDNLNLPSGTTNEARLFKNGSLISSNKRLLYQRSQSLPAGGPSAPDSELPQHPTVPVRYQQNPASPRPSPSRFRLMAPKSKRSYGTDDVTVTDAPSETSKRKVSFIPNGQSPPPTAVPAAASRRHSKWNKIRLAIHSSAALGQTEATKKKRSSVARRPRHLPLFRQHSAPVNAFNPAFRASTPGHTKPHTKDFKPRQTKMREFFRQNTQTDKYHGVVLNQDKKSKNVAAQIRMGSLFTSAPTAQSRDMEKYRSVCKLWLGHDYVTTKTAALVDLKKPFADLADRAVTPRVPWHDISSVVYGTPARFVAQHFIQRWNFTKREIARTKENYPILLPKSLESVPPLPQHFKKHVFPCNIQVLRSSSSWSAGLRHTESSIYSAYLDLIRTAQHYIYIENQFFISLSKGACVLNRIGNAIVEKILQAHRHKKLFRVFVIIPLVTLPQELIHWVYKTICRGPDSIIGRLREVIDDPYQYISFATLKTWALLKGNLVSEMIYVHSKLLLVDDKCAIIGSANLNDRSLLGDRDSEVALLIQDSDDNPIESRMNGQRYICGEFTRDLRISLMREHLGLLDEARRTSSGGGAGGDKADKEKTVDMDDVVCKEFFDGIWNKRANDNASVYDKLFNTLLPHNQARTIEELHKLATSGEEPWKEDVIGSRLLLKQNVKGFLVTYPTDFLIDADIVKFCKDFKQYILPDSIWV